jgi:hypothetical protein
MHCWSGADRGWPVGSWCRPAPSPLRRAFAERPEWPAWRNSVFREPGVGAIVAVATSVGFEADDRQSSEEHPSVAACSNRTRSESRARQPVRHGRTRLPLVLDRLLGPLRWVASSLRQVASTLPEAITRCAAKLAVLQRLCDLRQTRARSRLLCLRHPRRRNPAAHQNAVFAGLYPCLRQTYGGSGTVTRVGTQVRGWNAPNV